MLNQFLDKYIFTNTLTYKQNNFHLVNIPFVIFPIDLLVDLIKDSDVEQRKDLYYKIKESSKNYFMTKFTELKIDDKRQIDFVKNFFIASGWGSINLIDVDFDGKKAIIIVENSPFVKSLKGKVNFEVDIIMRSIFASLFSRVFVEDIECVESECSVISGEKCKFILKPASEFDFNSKIVRNQLRVD